MPRLDVSLSGSGSGATNQNNVPKPTANTLQLQRPSTSRAATINDRPNPSTASSAQSSSNNKPDVVVHQQLQTYINPPPAKDENLWGDADDEFILIASQMVDNMDMDAINQQIIVQSMNLSQNNAIETKMPDPAQDLLKNFLHTTEDDDRLFSEIDNFDNYGNPEINDVLMKTQQQNENERPPSPSVFKIPTAIRHEKRVTSTQIQYSTQNDMNFSFRPESHPQSTQYSQRIEIPRSIEPTGNFDL